MRAGVPTGQESKRSRTRGTVMLPGAWLDKRRFWFEEPIMLDLIRLIDCLLVAIAAVLALTQHGESPGDVSFVLLLIVSILLTSQIFTVFGAYRMRLLSHVRYLRLVAAWTTVMLLMAAVTVFAYPGQHPPLAWLAWWFAYGLAGVLAARLLLEGRLYRWYHGGQLARRLVITGAGDRAAALANTLHDGSDGSVRILGLFVDPSESPMPGTPLPCPILGCAEDLPRFVRTQAVDVVAVALPWHAEERLQTWVKRLKNLPVDVVLSPPSSTLPSGSWAVSTVSGIPFLKVSERPLSGWRYVAKGLEDRVIALILLILFGPMMLFIAAAVRLTSPGPALFRQKRYGFNNTVIEVLKFRTMTVQFAETDTDHVQQATRNDPRVTRLGRLLRHTSMDELPQLFNVLRGEMSLVGPRPHAISHNEEYAKIIDQYIARHRVKPGITGWAQINGFRGETRTVEQMESRIQYDLYYIENWSLLFDLHILARTALGGFVHPNAY